MSNSAPRRSNPVRTAPAEKSVHRCQPGPWGHLEYYTTYLEAPDALIRRLALPSQQTVWHFEEMTGAQIEEVFTEAGFSAGQLREVMEPRFRSMSGDLTRIFPPPPLVEAISPAVRASLYRVLARSDLNPLHRYPMQFDGPDLMEALDRTRLPAELINRISAMVYGEGTMTLFSDFPLLLGKISHPERERQLLRVLTRTRTLIARLVPGGSGDLAPLQDYWAPVRQGFDPRPLIDAVIRTEGVDSIDLVQFLPPGPRSQLFTYPGQDDCLSGRAPDGVWSAINFFTDSPLPFYLESEGLWHYLESRFRPASSPLRFGDLLVISAEGEQNSRKIRHVCVYLADDLVYTKNSAHLMTPWILSRLRDVASYHVRGARAAIRPYRLASLKRK